VSSPSSSCTDPGTLTRTGTSFRALPGAAERFVETAALGPTFLDEAGDPEKFAFDVGWLRGFARPALLPLGDQSPSMFAPLVGRLAAALPGVEVLTLPRAGHIPHATHPDAYVDAIVAFTHEHRRGLQWPRPGATEDA
jgi:pimeloyl-ACP methyl ester carboxylesterase